MSRPRLRLVTTGDVTTTTTTSTYEEAAMQAMRENPGPSLVEEAGGMGTVFHLRMRTAAYESAVAVTARVLQPALVDFLS